MVEEPDSLFWDRNFSEVLSDYYGSQFLFFVLRYPRSKVCFRHLLSFTAASGLLPADYCQREQVSTSSGVRFGDGSETW